MNAITTMPATRCASATAPADTATPRPPALAARGTVTVFIPTCINGRRGPVLDPGSVGLNVQFCATRRHEIKKRRALSNRVADSVDGGMPPGSQFAEGRERELTARRTQQRQSDDVAEEPEVCELLRQRNLVRPQVFVEGSRVEQRLHLLAR